MSTQNVKGGGLTSRKPPEGVFIYDTHKNHAIPVNTNTSNLTQNLISLLETQNAPLDFKGSAAYHA